jgi:hypothetical protein
LRGALFELRRQFLKSPSKGTKEDMEKVTEGDMEEAI